jgi:DNA-directed RNA polymerase specialized sigma24 family protein
MKGMFGRMNLEEIAKKMQIYIHLSMRWMPDVFDGVSGEDLPMEVLTQFLASPNGLGYDSARGPLDKFLIGVLKNKLKDHLRRQQRTAGSLDDPDFAQRVEEPRSIQPEAPPQTPEAQNHESTSLLSQLLRSADGDPQLTALVQTVADDDIEAMHNINQQLAGKLNTTPTDIVNRKKRLIRKHRQQLSTPSKRTNGKYRQDSDL